MARFILLFFFVSSTTFAQINPSKIDIVRDQWGVPHIYAPTDAGVAYGLAWATCEDDFVTVQKLLLAAKGRLGEVDGKGGAILDMLGHIVGIERMVDEKSIELFSPEYRIYLESYVQGLNNYAAKHPEKVLRKKCFPVNIQDVVRSYVLTVSLLTQIHFDVQKVMTGKLEGELKAMKSPKNMPDGSNAIAINSRKTADGNTFLAINSHQPLEGLFSWYEAHLMSDEGMNIVGGTFPGGSSIFHGVNEYLGWAATLNHPDLCDIYKLEMNPKSRLKYKMDEQWETLEKRPKRVKVKIAFLQIPITKQFYWSKYGTTLKYKKSYYSLRFPANMEILGSQQLYKMNKTKSLEEFKTVLNEGHFASTNIVYADSKDNIFMISNGKFPYRQLEYDWKGVVPGNTYKTLWEPKFHPVSELVKYQNPKSGYLFNTNGTPFYASGKEDNLKEKDFDPTFGYEDERKVNNRALRAFQLINNYDKISWDNFKTIKYDQKFNDSLETYNIRNLKLMTSLDPLKYPKLADAISVLNKWDYTPDPEDTESALLVFAFNSIAKLLMNRAALFDENVIPESDYVAALTGAKKHMMRHFGSLSVPLKDVQKHVRGDKELGIGGIPEVLAANFTQPYKKGKLRTYVGDSYIMLAKFTPAGVEIESVNAYGASNNPESKHYNDQMELFVAQKTKPMTLDKAKVYAEAKSVYHPE